MSFVPVKSGHGAVPPWEYLPAKADSYACGQLLGVNGGLLEALSGAVSTVPPYLCMSDQTVAADGDVLPVTQVSREIVYETTLNAAGSIQMGSRLEVSAGGLQAAANAAGAFEAVSLEGTAKDDVVRGRFV